jgi:RNA polymerase sigma factor (sigma-70 family)
MKIEAVVRQFQRLLEPGTIAGLSESQVLERFAERGDPVAFEAIIARHGSLVFTVCRQLLRDPNDVEDAFQATFLIFIKKAETLRQPERLGPWLYGVAYRVAIRARTRRRTKALPEGLADPRLASSVEDNEQLEILHDEIQRLPEKYRVPIVLCCIEKLSHGQTARQLGWPIGTVQGRLSRARDLLRDRLTRRGVLLSGGVPEALAFLSSRRMILPAATLRAATALLDGTVAGSLETLIKGVLYAMFTERLKHTGIIIVAGVIGLGTALTGLQAYERPRAKPGLLKADSTAQDVERNKARETKTVPVTKTAPEDRAQREEQERPEDRAQREEQERLQAEADLERSHQQLDQKLAHAALLRIELDMTTKRIEKARGFLEPPVPRTDADNLSGREREVAIRDLKNKLRIWEETFEHDKKRYESQWIDLSRLKRQIARESKTLGVTTEFTVPTVTELTRRLDALERKIDQIIDSLPAK